MITQLPQTFEQLRKLTVALIKPLEVHGFGMSGRQGSAIVTSFAPWLYSSGGGTVNFDTGEVLINNPASVDALEFWSSLVLKNKIVPPEALTRDLEEIVGGGQSDR